MKGIILAGGLGSRLYPSTKVVNKHLLPVYNQPMIYYPIRTLVESGITDIMIISSRQHVGDFIELLGSGSDYQANFSYKVQEGPAGIAHALAQAEDFLRGDTFALVLGDNIFDEVFPEEVKQFQSGARIFLKEVNDPERFGVAEIAGHKVLSLEEKPLRPKSRLAVTGLYLYDQKVFQHLASLAPSARGELEITDLNKVYLSEGTLEASVIHGVWMDAGTHESLFEASEQIRKSQPSFRPTVHSAQVVEKIVAGIVLYQTAEHADNAYFEPFFDSLLKQDYPNIEIVVLDNASPIKTGFEELQKKYPEITFLISPENRGFGGGHNHIIRNTKSDFYVCLNFDMILEPDFISKLVETMNQDAEIGSVAGKLKRWDFQRYAEAKLENNTFEDGKTNFLDSLGIRIRRSHRFEDRGQGEVDFGQYQTVQEIFGPTGAAALYRRSALESIAFVNDHGMKEYFDELFFVYKEDIDLAYRLQWAGWKSFYTPFAVGYHDRTTASVGNDFLSIIRNRKHKSRRINEWSFLNQELLLAKHFHHHRFSFNVKKATKWYKLKSLVYTMLFEPHLLRQFRRLNEITEQIEKRVLRMPKQVTEKRIETLMDL